MANPQVGSVRINSNTSRASARSVIQTRPVASAVSKSGKIAKTEIYVRRRCERRNMKFSLLSSILFSLCHKSQEIGFLPLHNSLRSLWTVQDLNLRLHPCHGCALPTELTALKFVFYCVSTCFFRASRSESARPAKQSSQQSNCREGVTESSSTYCSVLPLQKKH